MENDSKNTDIKALKQAVNQQQDQAFTNQSNVIQYVHDVKDALNRLVEQVVADQEQTSKLCADARAAIEGHTDTVAASAETEDALRLHLGTLEKERDSLQDKVDLLRGKLDEAKNQLRKMAEGSDTPVVDDSVRVELENRLHEEQAALEAARSRIAKLEAQTEASAATAGELDTLKARVAELESTLEATHHSRDEAESHADAATAELEALKNETSTAASRESELSTALEAARRELKTRQSEIEEVRALEVSRQATHGRLEEELSREKEATTELRAALEEASRHKDAAEEESAKLNHRITLMTETTQEHEATIRALQDQAKAATEAKEAAEAKTDELRTAARSVSDSERRLEKQVEEMEEELNLLRPLRPEARQLQDLVSALEIQLENVRLEKERLESEVTSELSRGTKSRLAEQLAEALKEQETAQETAKLLRRELEVLQDENSALRALGDAPVRVDLKFDDSAARQQLGDLLLSSGIITAEQLRDVIDDREANGAHGRIGQLFIDKGYASEDAVAQALAHQMKVPFVRIEADTIRHEAVRLISERIAEQHRCVPVRIENGRLVVAMENPMDLIAIENIERVAEMPVAASLATATDIERSIRINYRKSRIPRA